MFSELPGHGLDSSFDPDTIYEFITDVPLEKVIFDGDATTFTNNVAMYKKVFAILPNGTTDALLADAAPPDLALDLVTVTPPETVLGEPVVVSAQVGALGAAAPGATVLFRDIKDPETGEGEVFDAEWLPHIRAGDSHFVRVTYTPQTCGTHEIAVEVAGLPRGFGDELTALVDVGIDYKASIRLLLSEVIRRLLSDVRGLPPLSRPSSNETSGGQDASRSLNRELLWARQSLQAGRTELGIHHLQAFNRQVGGLEGKGRIDADTAEFLIGQSDQIIDCVKVR